jgi:transposase InsO family protein
VKIHRNAKTTPATRTLLQARVRTQGWSVAQAADAYGVSRQTIYRWLSRSTVDDRSSRPRQIGRRTSAKQVAAILALRQARWPAWRIAVYTQVPRSTVSAVLARHGLNRLRLTPPPGPVQRYERQRVGELVHLDMKRLGRIGTAGHRIHGDRSRKPAGLGWETVHVCIDDYSRASYVEVLPDQTAAHTTAFLHRAARWFARRGVRIERVMTDNGPGYLSPRFQHALAAIGARGLRTRPYRPQTNGKAERFIQTLLREWAYAVSYPTSAQRTRALQPWLRQYNGRRAHSALQHRAPVSRFPRVTQ